MGKKSRLKKLKKQPGKDLGKNLSKVAYLAYGAVIVAIASLAFTLLKPGFPSGHDIAAHIVRSKVLKEALYQGQFPVRWIEWAWTGTAHPMFNFYQGGFYYLVAFADLIIPSHIESIKIMVLLLWYLSAFFMFLFMRRYGNLQGALAALVFAFTPYIIADVFVRAAYPELAAIASSLCLLWSFDRLVRTAKPVFALPLSIALAGIITSHLPTLVIIAPLIIGYSLLLLVNKEVVLRGAFYTLLAIFLGIGLSSFYIFPALFELKYIKSELLTSGYYDFHPHFVYLNQLFDTRWGYGRSVEGPNDGMSFQFGILQWVIILLSVGVFVKLRLQTIGFWLLMISYAVFFLHDISLSFWENWNFLAFIQYPWRFLMVVAIASACLSGMLLTLLRKNWHKSVAILAAVALVFLLYRSFLAPSTFVRKEDFDIDAADWRKREGIVVNSFVEQGYLPREVEVMPRRDIAKWEVVNGAKSQRVSEKVIKYHYLSFVTISNEPFGLRFNIPYFPGWRILIDQQTSNIDHSNIYGFMHVVVPAGVHTVEATFTDTPVRSISNKLTLFSLVALVGWQGVWVWRRLARGRRLPYS